MVSDKLKESLQQLSDEIEHLPAGDSESEEKLKSLVNSVSEGLERPEDGEAFSVIERHVQDAIGYFQIEHPRITGILNDIMTALSSMGI